MLDFILACARDLLSETGCHPPTLWLEGTGGVVMAPILSFPKEQEDRLRLLKGLGEWLPSHSELGNLLHVYLISEAWYWERPVKSEHPLPPSEPPQRKGGLLLFDLDVAIETQHATLYEIRAGQDLRPIPRFQGKEAQFALLPTLARAYKRTTCIPWN